MWQKHFELVVFYSQMRLAKFQTDSQESIQKILAVQVGDCREVGKIILIYIEKQMMGSVMKH